MQDYNKSNLKRLLALFASVLVCFLAAVTATVAIRFWWASLPTAGVAIYAAAMLFYKGYYLPGKEETVSDTKARDPKTGRFVKK